MEVEEIVWLLEQLRGDSMVTRTTTKSRLLLIKSASTKLRPVLN